MFTLHNVILIIKDITQILITHINGLISITQSVNHNLKKIFEKTFFLFNLHYYHIQ